MESLEDIRQKLGSVPDPLALLQGIFAFSPVALQIYRADGHCVLVNDAFRELFGAEPPPDYNVLRDEIAHERGVLDLIHRAFAGETVTTPPIWYDPRELRQVKVEKGRRSCSAATFIPLRDALGIVRYVAIAFKDVTAEMEERERAEHAARQAERSYAQIEHLLRTAPVGISFLDRDLRYVRINQHLAAVNGVPVEDTLGRTIREVLPQLAPMLEPLYQRVFASGEPILDQEVSGTTPAEPGAQRHWLVSYYPVRDRDSRVFMVGAVVVEITERKRAEERQRFLAHASDILLGSLSPKAVLVSIARMLVPRLADLCVVYVAEGDRLRPLELAHVDLESEQRARRLIFEAPPEPERDLVLYQVLREQQPRLFADARGAEHLARLSEFQFHSAMHVPLIARDRALGVIDFVTDARSRRVYDQIDLNLAEELAWRAALAMDNARLYQEAQEAIHARDDFLSIASHELRTPLTPLKLHLEAMERGAPESEHRVRSLHRQTERLTRLVDELLDVSRLVGGRLRLQLDDVDLAHIVRDVVAALREQGEVVRASSELHLRADRPVVGRWDRLRVEQVVNNLLSNALKYGAGKPVDVVVEIAGADARLVVVDRGIGIPPEEHQRIFARFERAVSDRNYGGLGLGLYIVRQIVDALGGVVRVDSRPGEGATFTVEMPLAGPPQAIAPSVPVDEPGAQRGPDL